MRQYDGEIEKVLSLMANSRRRSILYCLLSNEYTDLPSLSMQIAAWEGDKTMASAEKDEYESVKTSLYHDHIPKLAKHNIIEFDDRSGDIIRAEEFKEIKSAVEHIKQIDESKKCGDHPIETTPATL